MRSWAAIFPSAVCRSRDKNAPTYYSPETLSSTLAGEYGYRGESVRRPSVDDLSCHIPSSSDPRRKSPLATSSVTFEVVLVLLSLTLSNEALEDVFSPRQLRFSCRRSSLRVPVGCREFLSLAAANPREERLGVFVCGRISRTFAPEEYLSENAQNTVAGRSGKTGPPR